VSFDKPADGPGVYALALSPDGKTLAVGLKAGVRLLAVADLKPTGELVVPKPEAAVPATPVPRPIFFRNWVVALAFAGEGRLVSCDRAGGYRIWDLARPGEFIALAYARKTGPPELAREANSVAVSPDGKTVAATMSVQGLKAAWSTLGLWDAETGKPIGKYGLPSMNFGNGVAFTPDGKHAVIGGERGGRVIGDERRGQIWVIDVESKMIVQTVEAPSRTLSLAVAPDGKTFVTGGADTTALVWKLDPK